MSLRHSTMARIRAHVLQCAFASVGAQTAPSVGEVGRFVHKWYVGGFSEYQLQLIIDKLVDEKLLEIEYVRHGKARRRTYRITQIGAMSLLMVTHLLHPQIKKGMEDLAARVAHGAEALIADYIAQGVTHD